jgi:hypothetical protein
LAVRGWKFAGRARRPRVLWLRRSHQMLHGACITGRYVTLCVCVVGGYEARLLSTVLTAPLTPLFSARGRRRFRLVKAVPIAAPKVQVNSPATPRRTCWASIRNDYPNLSTPAIGQNVCCVVDFFRLKFENSSASNETTD